ncbi:MAG: hypothetical protein P1V97_37590 [Planctomycetota bacterium]|nr:hypothetical protein [Planctomycetota bacterium]
MGPGKNHDLYEDDSKDEDLPEHRNYGFRIVRGLLIIFVLCIVGLFVSFLLPAQLGGRPVVNKVACANNLRILGMAAMMYSADYHRFPHMTDADKAHSEENIPDVFRTLMQGQYLTDPTLFVCYSSSSEFPLPDNPGPRPKDPKTWNWQGPAAPSAWAVKTPGKISVFEHQHLSYTYRKRMLDSSARSDSMLAADKVDRAPKAWVGNHEYGYNTLFADGHVRFAETDNKVLMERLYYELRMKTNQNPH